MASILLIAGSPDNALGVEVTSNDSKTSVDQ